MKTGLVLEGGAMRGMFTAGVLDVWMENKIPVDCIVGVSAGALFGVNYLSGQNGRVIRYNKRFNGDKNYLGLLPLLREGNIVSTQYAYEEVPHRLDPFDDDAFMASNVPFYAVVTNVDSGKPEYMRVESVYRQMDVLRASGSMPFVSRPVEINGKKYLDGGISDSVPFHWMEQQGMEKIIVVLTRDASYRKKKMSSAVVKVYGLKHPAIACRLKNRAEAYNRTIEELRERERQGKIFVIRPSEPIAIHTTEGDPEKLQGVYELGRRDAEKCLPELKVYLKKADCR